MQENRKDKRLSAKVAWYVLIIPCLKLLFAKKANVELMRWHAVGDKKDGMLHHELMECNRGSLMPNTRTLKLK
jgi:hypothetical protein